MSLTQISIWKLGCCSAENGEGERKLILPPDAPRRPRREFNDRDDRRQMIATTVSAIVPERGDRPRRERRDVGDMELYRIEVGQNRWC